MRKFVFYHSLTSGAKKAFNRGNGKYKKYAIDSDHIAAIDENGRILDWVKVIKLTNYKGN